MTSLKKLLAVLAASLPLVAAAQTAAPPDQPGLPPTTTPPTTATPATPPAPAAKVGGLTFKFSGDVNNRAMVYTNQAGLYAGAETITTAGTGTTANPLLGTVNEDTIDEMWVDMKYRFTVEASTDANAVKGVYGIELGAFRFGDASRGGGFSGDGNNYETRLAYLDFGIPGALANRLTIGLQPFLVNKYLWSETATAVQFKGDLGPAKATLAWARGREVFTSTEEQGVFADADNFLLRGDFVPSKDVKVGAFALYQHQNPHLAGSAPSYQLKRFGGNTTYDIANIGADAALKFGDIFVNLDGIYQVGEIEGGLDVSAFFAHADVGINLGAMKLTYTGWYATGDDDPTDSDVENYITTDVDTFDSVVLFEGGYVDDNYVTEAPHFLNFGAIFNKLALDYKVSPKVTAGAAVMYIMTAEDVTLANNTTENVLGTEIDAYVSYKPLPQLELAVNAGYLIAGDVMDAFETGANAGNGKADEDIFRMTARARYMF